MERDRAIHHRMNLNIKEATITLDGEAYLPVRDGKHACTLHRQAQRWKWHQDRWWAPEHLVVDPKYDLMRF
jgi:hypothetical protein